MEPFFSSRYLNVIGGDFNSIFNPTQDKQGGNVTSRQYALRVLHNLTSQFDLVDIWRQRNPNKRGLSRTGRDPRQNNSFISTRIDRFYISQPITPYISDTSIMAYPHNFFWDYKKPLTTRDILALPLSEGGFNIHRIQTKIQALRLNTLRRLISPEPAHWKHFTAYFLRLQHLQLGLHTLTLDYKPQDIHPSISAYHRELLIAWNKHGPLKHRILDPVSLADILQESIFLNPLIKLDNRPLNFPSWISAGLASIHDLCYIAIPGFLPSPAIHKLLHHLDPDPVLQRRTTH